MLRETSITRSSAHDAGHSESVVERIANTLAARIIAGIYAPGEKLLQDQIALEFRASHVPVREAFRRLEAQGLAKSEPRKGVRVAALDSAAVSEASQMRIALEALALRQAMPHITFVEIAAARDALTAADQCRDINAWEAANHAFHSALYSACGMPRLLGTIDDLQKSSSRYLQAAWRDARWKLRSDKEHRQLLRAVKMKDIDKATALLGQHIEGASSAVLRLLQKY